MTRHVIEAIRYARGVPDRDAPMTCSCGWEGLLGAWDLHKHPGRQPSDVARIASIQAANAGKSNAERARDGQRRREGRYGLSPEELSIRISDGMRAGKRRRGAA
jgi:hypothetical protein